MKALITDNILKLSCIEKESQIFQDIRQNLIGTYIMMLEYLGVPKAKF